MNNIIEEKRKEFNARFYYKVNDYVETNNKERIITLDLYDVITEDIWQWIEDLIKEKKITINSEQLIGKPKNRFDELKHKNWDWSSFYNGWIEGRASLIKEIESNN